MKHVHVMRYAEYSMPKVCLHQTQQNFTGSISPTPGDISIRGKRDHGYQMFTTFVNTNGY